MKPSLERLPYQPDSSLAMLERRLDQSIPFQWHHHPEFELTLTQNSRGHRFIGDHVAPYADCDLALVGPNLPHTWASESAIAPDQPHHVHVIWFHPDWAASLSQSLVEFRALPNFLARADRGLGFSPALGASLRPAITRFFNQPPAERLFTLLGILTILAQDTAAQPLASRAARPASSGAARDRIDRVLAHIHAYYAAPIKLADLADIAALSLSGLHRMFVSQTRSSISAYITALRIGDACALLSGTDLPVAHIAERVGYGALANFNRQFKVARAMTPREYRAHFRLGQ